MTTRITKPEPLETVDRKTGYRYWGICVVYDDEFVPDHVVVEVMERLHLHHVRAKESVDRKSVSKFMHADIYAVANAIFQECGHSANVSVVLI